MARFWKRILVSALAVAASLVGASEIWPERAASALLSGLNMSAGLREKSVQTSFGDVHYLEGGEGQTVVFLHGIYALKEHWIDMSREISDEYRVILLDLPGFGENQRLDPDEYDFERQTRNVRETLDAIGVERFHVAANSMGAQIAGQLAIMSPDRVRSIAFIGGPVGVASPTPSDMERAIADGHRPLVVTSREEYDARMPWLFPETPFIPRPIARFWTSNEVSHAEMNVKIWGVVSAFKGPWLEELAPRVTQPSLILWCNEDRIFHVSGAPVLADALPNDTLAVLNGCGHLPMLDRPADAGQALLQFLKGLNPS